MKHYFGKVTYPQGSERKLGSRSKIDRTLQFFPLDPEDLARAQQAPLKFVPTTERIFYSVEPTHPEDGIVTLYTRFLREMMSIDVKPAWSLGYGVPDIAQNSSSTIDCVAVFKMPSTSPLSLDLAAKDFPDHLRNLQYALKNLSEYLRGVNDPDVLNAELKTTRSYIDASLCFFDQDKYSNSPNEVPREIADGLLDRMKRIDWGKVSSEARQWVQLVVKSLKTMLS